MRAAVEGVFQGVVTTIENVINHPVETAACAVAGRAVLAYQAMKIMYQIADIGITYVSDAQAGMQKWNDFFKPVDDILKAIYDKEITVQCCIKNGTAFLVELKAQSKLLSGLNKCFNIAQSKAQMWKLQNPMSSPQQYMTTPEGIMFKAFHETLPIASQKQPFQEAANKLANIVADIEKERELFRFTGTAEKHMTEMHRRIPIQILNDIIQAPISIAPDPRGSTNALMYYAKMWKNGKQYNVEVLYDKATNQIMHFLYTNEALGPLPKV